MSPTDGAAIVGAHVDRLAGGSALEVVRHPCSCHRVAYDLSATGELDRIVSPLVA